MLSPGQIAHFRSFGYLILRQAFDGGEMERIQRLYHEILDEDRQGKPLDRSKRHLVLGFMEMRAEFVDMLEDDRLHQPLAQLLGEDFIFTGSDGNLYSGDTNWHPDSSREIQRSGYRRIKVLFYLDPLTVDTGCLRVIPGSHRPPRFDELLDTRAQDGAEGPFGVPPCKLPFVALETLPGDVVFFDTNIWHGSFGGGEGRRMISLSYGDRPTCAAHDGIITDAYAFNMTCIKEMGYTQRDWMYGERLLRSERPRIKRMASRLVELGLR